VGTGSKSLYAFITIKPNSEVRNAGTYGVLKLTLHPRSYDWKFVPVAGQTFTDSGTTNCH
jgi:acid phosphatase type 7